MAWDRPPIPPIFGRPIDAIDLYAAGTQCLEVPAAFVHILRDSFQFLLSPDAWQGDVSDVALTLAQVMHFYTIFGTIENECTPEDCPEIPPTTEPPEYPPGFEIFESEGNCMSGCSIPYGSLRWNGNTLEYLYCGQWYPVEGQQGTYTPPPELVPDPLPDGMTEPSACAIAQKIATTQALIVQKAMQSVGTLDFLWGWANFEDDVNSAVPYMDLDNETLYNMFYHCWAINNALLSSEAQNPDIPQALACAYVGYLQSSVQGIDNDTYSQLKSIDKAAINSIVKDSDFLGLGVEIRRMWEASLDCMGKGDIQKLTTNVIDDGSANCDCPGYDPLAEWSTTYDWVVDWKFDQGQPYGIQFRNDNGQSGMVAGGLTMLTNTTGSETLGAWRTVTVNTGTVKAYHIQWYMGLPFNAADWGINGDVIGEAELKGYVVDDGGNNYHITRTGVTNPVDDIGGSGFGLPSFQGSWDDTKNPKFPVVTRVVIAGVGAHPFGG